MAIRQVRAFILHRREVTESSLILSVFSDLAGKLHLLAKGARRKRSPFLGRTELFSLCHLTYYESRRRGLNILSESEVIDSMSALREDDGSFAAACRIAELADMGTALSSPSPGVFDLLREAFACAGNFPDRKVVERYFELHLLARLGYSLLLDRCAGCGAPGGPMGLFSARAGGMICRRCRGKYPNTIPVSAGSLSILRYLRSVPLRSAHRLRLTARQAGEMKAALRAAVLYYLEREPRSDRAIAEMLITGQG